MAPTGVRWGAALLVLAGVLIYWNSLPGVFVLDDQGAIVDNPQIRDWSTALSPEPGSSISGRPLVSLSFALNYALGGLDVRGYHVWNIAVHLVCALLLFGFVRRTLELPRVRAHLEGHSTALAFAAALLWCLHPLNTEVVDYLSQRSESMMALFYVLALYAGIRAVSRGSVLWPWAAVLASAAGMACKESMATLPLVAALYDRIFLFDSWRQSIRVRWRLYVGLVATWLVLAALNSSGPRSEVAGFSTGVSSWTYLLNQTVMLTTYVGLTIWPKSLVAFYGWPLPLTLGDVWPHALFVTVLLFAVLGGLVRASMPAFLGAWFFITLAPTSSFVPIATEVGAERRMYLALAALTTLAVIGASRLWDVLARRWRSVLPPRAISAGGIAMFIFLCGALAAATIARNREYESALTLARTVVERRPSGVAHHILAEQLVFAGRHEEAVTELRRAVALGNSRARYPLGIELFNAGKLNEAVEQFEAFSATWGLPYRLVPRWLEPPRADVVSARVAIARVFAVQGRWPQSAEQSERALALAPSHLEARLFLANALFGQQKFEEASVHYQAYLKARPNDVQALTNFGVGMVAGGRMDDAVAAFRRAVEADPRSANARRVLAMALMDRGDFAEAAQRAQESLALKPDDPELRELLGRATAAARAGVLRRP